jgi:DNA primase
MARRCATIWPDNDEAGRRYAQEVTEKLLAQGCTVRVIDVEKLGLPKKGDAVDWLAANPAATAAEIAALPCVEARRGEPKPKPLQRELPPSTPFPIDALETSWASPRERCRRLFRLRRRSAATAY